MKDKVTKIKTQLFVSKIQTYKCPQRIFVHFGNITDTLFVLPKSNTYNRHRLLPEMCKSWKHNGEMYCVTKTTEDTKNEGHEGITKEGQATKDKGQEGTKDEGREEIKRRLIRKYEEGQEGRKEEGQEETKEEGREETKREGQEGTKGEGQEGTKEEGQEESKEGLMKGK